MEMICSPSLLWLLLHHEYVKDERSMRLDGKKQVKSVKGSNLNVSNFQDIFFRRFYAKR